MKNYKIYKFTALFLSVVMVVLSLNLNVLASDTTSTFSNEPIETYTGNFSQEFYEATDDTIICYMNGYPIRKKDVDSTGVVLSSVIEKIESEQSVATYDLTSIESEQSVSTYAATANTRTIPTGYNNAIIQTTLTAPRYQQITKTYYFTSTNGAKFATGLEAKAWEQIVATVAGYIPFIGDAINILFTASSLYKSSVASQIRERTDDGKKVHINEASSSYGTFYGVFDWNNRVIETHNTYDDGITKEVINNLQYK